MVFIYILIIKVYLTYLTIWLTHFCKGGPHCCAEFIIEFLLSDSSWWRKRAIWSVVNWTQVDCLQDKCLSYCKYASSPLVGSSRGFSHLKCIRSKFCRSSKCWCISYYNIKKLTLVKQQKPYSITRVILTSKICKVML